jgi:hypothetical protein
METRSSDLHLETYEGIGTALILSARYLIGHDWQTEKILCIMILNEADECALLRDKHFGFRPGHSTSL